ncbi:MAG: SDR family oxidoreductase, partial [Tannerella sp.]|nr:SDR family oxidoreductase [Tannerella sp.]
IFKNLTDISAEISIFDGDTELLNLSVFFKIAVIQSITPPPHHSQPPSRELFSMEDNGCKINAIESIKKGEIINGKYHTKYEQQVMLLNKFGLLTQPLINSAFLLMWSSYFVGMIMPGQQALYSQFELNINDMTPSVNQMEYNVKLEKIDTTFNLLQMTFNCHNSTRIAEGKISAFIRPIIKHDILNQSIISNQYKGILRGKTALITGASRGLGARLAQVLSSMSCHVIINFQYSLEEAVKLQETIRNLGGTVELWQGNIADIDWISLKKAELLRNNKKLDILICNACQPPKEINFELNTINRVNEYISKNFEMTSIPLSLFSPMIDNVNGYGIIISSISVKEPLVIWPQYISLKSAIEGLVSSISIKYRKTNWFVIRPPRLLTDMTNSPIGNYTSADPYTIARKICDYIFINNTKIKGVNIFTPKI